MYGLKKKLALILVGCSLMMISSVGYAEESTVQSGETTTQGNLSVTDNPVSIWTAPAPTLENNEITVFGKVGQGSIVDRLDRVDMALLGAVQTGTVTSRIQKEDQRLRGGSVDKPSIIARLNATEWSLDKQVSLNSLDSRLTDLETRLTGKMTHDSLETRSKNVIKHVADNSTGTIVTVPRQTLVRIEFVDSLTSKTAKVGDTARVKVAEDIFVEGLLVFPKGALGQVSVKSVKPAKTFARNGKLELEFDYVETFDGRPAHFIQGAKSLDATETYAKAAGASIAGAIILGPIGLVTGAFVKGENAVVKEGSLLYIETDNEYEVISIHLQ